MPYKYIGRTTSFKGKTLWEIVGNLKNFGVGRIVVRSVFERYPEPSYMKILKVETLPTPEVVSVDKKTFRGKPFPRPIVIESSSYKTDYRLIPKVEEEKYCKRIEEKDVRIFPRTFEFPPIMKELILREMKEKGEKLTEVPPLEIVYSKCSKKTKYRIAKDGEEPNVEIVMGFGTPVSPSLYEGIKL
ncbi:hypothetical protein NQ314_007183 [Rhamnusium bicolor]|uniref:Mitochondrial ribosomal protein S34 n=1 Tax=Rhamnusium bicolor TaxID=1586634 RepID=A0AAV8YT09_9CUCU|nr:hypothetical protein NQ314_007183 [Rhamnusium bicolor]